MPPNRKLKHFVRSRVGCLRGTRHLATKQSTCPACRYVTLLLRVDREGASTCKAGSKDDNEIVSSEHGKSGKEAEKATGGSKDGRGKRGGKRERRAAKEKRAGRGPYLAASSKYPCRRLQQLLQVRQATRIPIYTTKKVDFISSSPLPRGPEGLQTLQI
eukprot:6183634-Pleurochrysis_carterae.AAC.1